VIEVADGGVHSYMGAYADYLRSKAEASVVASAEAASEAPTPARLSTAAAGQDPAARRRLAADLREAERQVTLTEERLRAVEAALSDPGSIQGDVAALSWEHAALHKEVETLTARWAELAQEAE
jgi:hypothetical protein